MTALEFGIMRRVKLSLACSLDHFIAAPDGSIDWIRMDADYGLAAFFASIDTLLMGRVTYDFARKTGNKFFAHTRNYVFSSTLSKGPADGVNIVGEDAVRFTRTLQKKPGKDIWLFGGHKLAASFLAAGLIDDLTLAVHPILLGGGTPVFGPLGKRQLWQFEESKAHPNGVITLRYSRP